MRYTIKQNYDSLREAAPGDKPREKLQRLGVSALTDHELIMLIVGSGSPQCHVEDLAGALLEKIDTCQYSLDEIMGLGGLGIAKASAVAAALELGRRRVTQKPRSITSPSEIYGDIRHYADRTQEQLIVVMLNGAHEVLGSFVATLGFVNRTYVHPREVFSEPIARRAAAIIIAHNHPSGNVLPSEEDKDVTVRLRKAGDLLGIPVMDHLVISDREYYSFLEHGLL